MAIDTENKRRSTIGGGLPWHRVLPVPDGTISARDRRHIWTYAGIGGLSLEALHLVQGGELVVARAEITNPVDEDYWLHWYRDGVWYGACQNATEESFSLRDSEHADIAAIVADGEDYDPHAAPPHGYPAQRLLEWPAATDTDVAHYRIEQATGQGEPGAEDWAAIADCIPHDGRAVYCRLSDTLADLTWYWWRIVPVGLNGNDGTPVTIGPERIVRRPDQPDVTATFSDDTQKVTFAAS